MPMSSRGQGFEFAAGEARAADGRDAPAIGPFNRFKDVGAVAAAANGDEQIAGAGEILELFDEDAVEPLVVAPGENVGGVVGEAEHLEAFFLIVFEVLAAQRTLPQVFTEVGGIGAAAAVAADEDEAVGAVAFVDEVGKLLDLLDVDAEQFLANAFKKGTGAERGSEHDGTPNWHILFQPML